MMITRRQTLFLLTAGAMAAPRSRASALGPLTRERGLMGTRFAITCDHPDRKLVDAAIDAAFARAKKIEGVASDYIVDSELLALSARPAEKPVEISPLLFRLLQEARELAEKTDGLFDPTIGPLTKLWRETRRRKALPNPATLAKAAAAVGWKNLLLDARRSTATFAVPGMRLDLGGIAKGQAADQILEILNNYGVSRTLITAGGDVRAGDAPIGEKGWNIGVRSFDKNHDVMNLSLSNRAVSTSGDLQQFIEIDGVRYSHIIDPATGLGLIRQTAVTIVAATATISDALATACCISTPDRAIELTRKLNATLC